MFRESKKRIWLLTVLTEMQSVASIPLISTTCLHVFS